RHGTQVFAHNYALRADALQRGDAEQLLGGEPDVGSHASIEPVGDPELPYESQDVVYTERAGVPERHPEQLPPVIEAAVTQACGVQRRQPPVLPLRCQRVRRSADAHARREDVAEGPGIAAPARHTRGE